ncbi:MAG: hypothetical protein EOO38_08325 [Cytophagaceae bacterium]|nr:MAG: hypothetical protein EOO38_08325 [Cytophagaceae bacterium]
METDLEVTASMQRLDIHRSLARPHDAPWHEPSVRSREQMEADSLAAHKQLLSDEHFMKAMYDAYRELTSGCR